MITTLITAGLVVGAFVFGVLFGRANKKKVQLALDEANALIEKLKSAVKK